MAGRNTGKDEQPKFGSKSCPAFLPLENYNIEGDTVYERGKFLIMGKKGDSDKLFSLKDLYEELFKCRDFEIDHLWQRSVFLGAFLLAVAAGYGTFVNEHIKDILSAPVKQEADCSVKIESEQYEIEAVKTAGNDNGVPSECFHGICLGLAGLGIVFSQLWIMMAKGSKRWQEKFEESIAFFYKEKTGIKVKKELFGEEITQLILNESIPYFGKLHDKAINNSLVSTKGGEYSVSRINIIVGQVTCIAWMVLAGIHFYQTIGFIYKDVSNTIRFATSVVSIVTYSCVLGRILMIFAHSED